MKSLQTGACQIHWRTLPQRKFSLSFEKFFIIKPMVWLGQLCDYWETTKNNKCLSPQRHINVGWPFWWKLWDAVILTSWMPDRYTQPIPIGFWLGKSSPAMVWRKVEVFKKKKKNLGNMENILHLNFRRKSIFFFLFWFWFTRVVLPFHKCQLLR